MSATPRSPGTVTDETTEVGDGKDPAGNEPAECEETVEDLDVPAERAEYVEGGAEKKITEDVLLMRLRSRRGGIRARSLARRVALPVLLAGLMPALGQAAPIAIFYYPWYGNPAHDGLYQHWNQGGHLPPADIAADYYPARGPYSSSDPAVLAAQMGEISRAGITQVVTSWWGRGSPEDRRLPAVIAAARSAGLDVAIHLEPYPGRSPATVLADTSYLYALGIRDIYVYQPEEISALDWLAVNAQVGDLRLFAGTGKVGFAHAAGFRGIYTYDVVVYAAASFARICAEAHAVGLLCAPSVGPGYDATKSTGDPRVEPRRRGLTYDTMWRAALAAGADQITITSYNEWSEGTQIEPAGKGGGPRAYRNYSGAWGLRGRAAEGAYLRRTSYWAGLFNER